VAKEFRPLTTAVPTAAQPAQPPAREAPNSKVSPPSHSLSSLLNTEMDTIVAPAKKKTTFSSAVGNRGVAPNLPSLKQLAAEQIAPTPSPISGLFAESNSLQSESSSGSSRSQTDSVFNQSLFGTGSLTSVLDARQGFNSNSYAFFNTNHPHDLVGELPLEEDEQGFLEPEQHLQV
jgi:hypothetical protein